MGSLALAMAVNAKSSQVGMMATLGVQKMDSIPQHQASTCDTPKIFSNKYDCKYTLSAYRTKIGPCVFACVLTMVVSDRQPRSYEYFQ